MLKTRVTLFLLIFFTSLNLLSAIFHWYAHITQVDLVSTAAQASSQLSRGLFLTGYLLVLAVTVAGAWTAMSRLVRVFWVTVTVQMILSVCWMIGSQDLASDSEHLLKAIQETVFSSLFGVLLIYYRRSKFDVFLDASFGGRRRIPA